MQNICVKKMVKRHKQKLSHRRKKMSRLVSKKKSMTHLFKKNEKNKKPKNARNKQNEKKLSKSNKSLTESSF